MNLRTLLTSAGFILCSLSHADDFYGYDLQLAKYTSIQEIDGHPTLVMDGPLRSDGGLTRIHGLQFADGTIEFEVRSVRLNSSGHNYPGIALRMQNDQTFELAYLRFRDDLWEGIFAVPTQDGISHFERFSGPKYFTYRELPHGEWIKVRYELDGLRLSVYLNDEISPSFNTERLENGHLVGGLAFWAYPTSGELHFRKLKISAK